MGRRSLWIVHVGALAQELELLWDRRGLLVAGIVEVHLTVRGRTRL
jgi:hypothetical protein